MNARRHPMTLRLATVSWLAVLFLGTSSTAMDRQDARLERIGDIPAQSIYAAPSLSTADTCYVNGNDVIVYRIDGWVVGFELYKSLLDPSVTCSDPYPFAITAINMPMIFDGSTSLTVSVDVETVDSTTIPGCPIPGVMLAISSEYELTVPPGGGLFNIWIPLDSPVVVNSPFFAGFYIGNAVDTSAHAAILTDSVPVPCVTYNIWDETVGWIDLVNNSYYNFPGRLAMEASGIPGGSATPQAALLTPADQGVLFGNVELWAWDEAFSGAVDYISFDYSSGGPFVEIGRDYDGTSPLRDGVSPAQSGNGFNVNWDFSFLSEGSYILRATAIDTLGGNSSDSVTVYLEPTPPVPTITSPTNGSPFCTPLDIHMTCSDENLSYIEIYRRDALTFYSAGLTSMSQFSVGDNNGNPSDGNRAIAGEFGDYYCAPTAAAIALKAWYDHGYTEVMQQGSSTLTIEAVAEELAALFHTRENLGTSDDAVYGGLASYSENHGDVLDFDWLRDPDYFALRTWVEDEERTVILGIGGNPGLWVAVNGFAGWMASDSTYQVTVANPLTGGLPVAWWRNQPGYAEINLDGNWQQVDMMISMVAKDWSANRSLIGVDFSGGDGWSYSWDASGLTDGSVNIFRVVGRDATQHCGASTFTGEYNCALVYVPGDYNDDRIPDIADLSLLIDFITRGGDPPSGGAQRADCNCDNVINITDVVYYMNYLYGTASPPCR